MSISFKRILRLARGLFPTRLPLGGTEFEQWVSDFESTYRLPTTDKDSIRFALAAMIINLGPTTAYKSKHYFFLSICSGVAKQVAGSVFHDIKQRQLEAQKNATQQQ